MFSVVLSYLFLESFTLLFPESSISNQPLN